MKRLIMLLLVAVIFMVSCATEDVAQQEDEQATENKVEEKNNPDKKEKENESIESKSLAPLTVHYIDAEQGDAALIQFTNDEDTYTILYDAGDWQGDEVVPYLENEEVDFIDIVMISHPHADHIGQLEKVLNTFEVGEVWMTGNTANSNVYEQAAEAILDSDADYEEPEAGDIFDIGELAIQILHPSTLTGGLNEDSLSVHFAYGDTAFLFTGDAYVEQEEQMINRDMDIEADFLQLGHHGSKTSTSQAFIEEVNPQYAIYSAGSGNSYGHPHQEVLDRLDASDVKIYGTDVHGNIIVTTDGKEANIETSKEGKVAAGKETTVDEEAASKSKKETNSKPDKEAANDHCVDINEASKSDLEQIIHIGDKRADDLIESRPFDNIEDLQRVDGLGPARIDDIIDENIACIGG